MDTQSDEQLVADLRLGLMDAFTALYERYRRSIYSFCLQMTADRLLAEDATHDTFIRMFDNIRSLNDPSVFRSWLYAIARNQVYKILQKQKPNGRLTDDVVWSGEMPDAALESAEEREMIDCCIKALKLEYREVLTLREFKQLSYAEIAAVTGATESSVKSRLFKARNALAEKLRKFNK